eukprot:TRINITY_DN3623_c0_g1_i4.p1 TRINITY_DN3623_c0_g1~~TRINITY_DN3623_c0_g1_i4.p1  ORF type:complete len:246 (-),score=79.51 TRINITY_DN3623_c0_g1_i4:128-865(-)
MEKVKPLEAKLKYQIDKLLNAANATAAADPLQFKPNPDALINKTEDIEDEEGGQDVYQPPKLAEVVFDNPRRRFVEDEKMKKRLARSKIVQSLRSEFSDRPEEVVDRTTVDDDDSEERERTRFEEDNFTRLTVSKKDKKKKKLKRSQLSELLEADDFGDLAVLDQKRQDDDEFLNKKRQAYDDFLEKEKKQQKKKMRFMGSEGQRTRPNAPEEQRFGGAPKRREREFGESARRGPPKKSGRGRRK